MSASDLAPRSDTIDREHHVERPVPRTFRPDIEALRAIGVLLVVLYHAHAPWLPGGYVGVDVFFVVSGFLITNQLYLELSRTGRLRLGRFYARRARRLLPAATLVIVTTLVATWVLVSGLRAARVGTEALWTAAFSANIFYARNGVDYQANQDPSPLQHYWSLAAEEQFYLVWPLAMLVVTFLWLKVARRGTRGLRPLLAVLAVLVIVVSFAYSLHLMEQAATMAYFLTPARAWELAIGALLALAAPAVAHVAWLGRSWVTALGLAAIVASAVIYTDATPFPGTAALLPTLGAGLVIAAGMSRQTRLERWALDKPPVQLLGKVSYSWYLWHWPLLILVADVREQTQSFQQNLWICALALMLAIWTYSAVEDPIRIHPRLVRHTVLSLGVGVLVVAMSVGVAFAAINIGPREYRSGASVAEVEPNAVTEAVQASAATQRLPGNLEPSLEDAGQDKPDLNAKDGISCMVDLLTAEISEEPGGTCVAGGTEGGSHTVVLVGDSHAYQWVPALTEISLRRDWRLVSMTKGGCTLNDVDLINTMLKRDYVECYAWREKVMERIAEEDPELIITTAAIFNPREGDFTDRWVEGVSRTTSELVDLGAPVYVISDTPYPAHDVPDCLAENPTSIGDCTRSIGEAYSDNDRRVRSDEAAREAGAHLIDPAPWFCNVENCPVVIGNVVVYSDNSHVTETYSRTLATVLAETLPALGG